MRCLSQIVGCFTYVLEQLGLYEPQLNIHQARDRLSKEGEIWEKHQQERAQFWCDIQADNKIGGESLPLVEKAIICLNGHNIQGGIAVDLGCGITNTAFNLLERGWKVYAVDSSDFVIGALAQKVSQMGRSARVG